MTSAFCEVPRGMRVIPSMSEITAAIEDAGLWITDVEVLRLHYAETAKAWLQRRLLGPKGPAHS